MINLSKSQSQKIKELLHFLNKQNIYFSNIIKKLPVTNNIDEQYNSLPYITKKEIRENYSDYITPLNSDYIYEMTTGTTGIPLKCVKSIEERLSGAVILWKLRKQWDTKVSPQNFYTLYGKAANQFGNFFDFTEENMIVCFTKLLSCNPRWISGPITAIERYAKLIQNGKIKYNKKSIKFIELAGEYNETKTRQFIEQIFDCKTVNQYGTRETWCIAYECPLGKLHLLEDNFVIEIKNKEKYSNISSGEIVVTSLIHKTMPIIKYQLNDLGEINQDLCSCGKKTRTIDLAGGRVSDLIKGPKMFLGDTFFKRIIDFATLEGYDCIDYFRVEQIRENHFVFNIVKGENFDRRVLSFIKKKMIEDLGEQLVINFVFVEEIPPSVTGKHKIFISNI